MTEEIKDRVLIIGDVIRGFRVHGPFADNEEAFAYVDRHRELIERIHEGWAGESRALKLVNFDTMSARQVATFENNVGRDGWDGLQDGPFTFSVLDEEELASSLGGHAA